MLRECTNKTLRRSVHEELFKSKCSGQEIIDRITWTLAMYYGSMPEDICKEWHTAFIYLVGMDGTYPRDLGEFAGWLAEDNYAATYEMTYASMHLSELWSYSDLKKKLDEWERTHR